MKPLFVVLPRIHIEFASESPVAAILRRGPSKWVRLLSWNTITDTVEAGSWFNGRIYENGCSVSPDGKLFAYFATKYHGTKTRGVDYAWTAVGRLPWLTALALWPQSDTWGGRTRFIDDQTLMIDCPHWEDLTTKDCLPEGFRVMPRWIGVGAPEQELPPPAQARGSFDGTAGIDQSGNGFKYLDGKLLREDRVIVDLGAMLPDPKPSPEGAYSW